MVWAERVYFSITLIVIGWRFEVCFCNYEQQSKVRIYMI
jgi:hypothetical protein